jgi:iron(III) transport system substrate-binding protein
MSAKRSTPRRGRGARLRGVALVLAILLAGACAPGAPRPAASAPAVPTVPSPASSPAPAAESLDDLYEKARQEGEVSLYGTLNRNAAPKIFEVFESRFPGVKVNWTDGTAERLTARIIAEARGGKVLVDVLQTNIENIAQLYAQGLVADLDSVPEAAAYPETLKGPYWLASDIKFYVVGWNTNRVRPEEEPQTFEDLADPRWKGRIMIDSGDAQFLAAIAKYKYGSDERAFDLLRRIAANDPEFHTGHSELIELLIAGQRDVCFTCFSHHFPPRLARGAPLGYSLAEGIGLISANATFKNAPHPHAARLFIRWVASEEGQQAYAQAGQTPAHPDVAPVEKTRPETIYPLTASDMQDYSRYERQWRETFRLRAGQ